LFILVYQRNNNKTYVIVRIDDYENQDKPRVGIIAHLKTQLVQLSTQVSEQNDLIVNMRKKIEELKEEKELANTVNATKKRTIRDLIASFEYRSEEDIEKECVDVERITSNSMHIQKDNTVSAQGVTINLNDTDGSMDEGKIE
jgi:GTPase involved in cell partitioning and DNA repair